MNERPANTNLIDSLCIRPIAESDSLEELTRLLHAAYKRLGDMGLRFVATYQTVEQTRSRIESGECFVALVNDTIVGTITLYTEPYDSSSTWYQRQEVARFGQFGVEPEWQGQGIGNRMIQVIMDRARQLGMKELALDTSEKATHLIEYYQRNGWREVEQIQWDVTNYRSVVMSKRIAD